MFPQVGGHPLRGRTAEVAAIGDRLDEVRSGVGSVIIIEGKAGLGKTRLLEACASMAAERSFRVGRGVAEPHRRAAGLDVLFDALFSGDDPLLARNALSDLHASPEQRFWLLQDIQALIEKAALRDPLLICLDDLHWPATLRRSDAAATGTACLPARRLGDGVPPEPGPSPASSAKEQMEHAGAEMIRLGPLRREAVTELATDVLGASPAMNFCGKPIRSGNPFLLIEFFRGLQDERIVKVEGGRATLLEERMPQRISDDMRVRLLRMSPAAYRMATLASALGMLFSVHELAQLARMPIPELLDPIKNLVQAGIFIEERRPAGVRTRPDPRGSAGQLLDPVRRALDRQAADVLLAEGALPIEVAQQLADCAEPGDEVAIATMLEAARNLSSSDPASSAALAGRALELRPHDTRSGVPLSRRARLPSLLRAYSRRRPDSPPRPCGRHCPPRKRQRSGWRWLAYLTCPLMCGQTTPARHWHCPGFRPTPVHCSGPRCSTPWWWPGERKRQSACSPRRATPCPMILSGSAGSP